MENKVYYGEYSLKHRIDLILKENIIFVNITMKKTVIIMLLLFAVKNLDATPELDIYSFSGNHIEIVVVYRYDSPVERLYYKSLIENLDSFIDSLKHTGKLNRGKIHLSIQTAIWMDGDVGVEMYRWKNGYYCRLNALIQPITQDYMTKIITYRKEVFPKWVNFRNYEGCFLSYSIEKNKFFKLNVNEYML